MTFEHRHENKSCSACRDRVNERVKVVKVAKVVKVKVFQNIPGSQLLSDFQTFFKYSFTYVVMRYISYNASLELIGLKLPVHLSIYSGLIAIGY